jgi:hypothetical protein
LFKVILQLQASAVFEKKLLPPYKYTHYVNEDKNCMILIEKNVQPATKTKKV